MAINPTDPTDIVMATRSDLPDFACQIWYSRNGGATWAASTVPAPSKGGCWASAAAFDDAGHVYVSAQDRAPHGAGPQQMFVWASTDGGQSFAPPVVIPAASVGGGEARAWQGGIAVDSSPSSPHHGRVYVSWEWTLPPGTPPPHDRTNLSFSDDHGQTWSPKVEEAAGTFPAGNEEFPKPAVAPDGTVYVVYRASQLNQPLGGICDGFGFSSGTTPPYDCPVQVLRYSPAAAGAAFVASFDPGSDVRAAPAHFASDPAASESDGIAVAPDGTILVTYAAVPNPPNGSCSSLDVFVVRSSDRGVTWSAPVRISDDPCASGSSHRDPWISIAPNGRVDAIFQDNRNDSSHGFLYDTFYANSTDDGQSFGANVRLTPHSFDATHLFTALPTGFQTNEYDTSSGIASTNAGALGAWPDTRNDTANAGVSDVFASAISLVGPSRSPSPAPSPSPLPISNPPAGHVFAGSALLALRLAMDAKGNVVVKLSCSASAAGACNESPELLAESNGTLPPATTSAKKKSKKRKLVRMGRTSVSAHPGQTLSTRIHLSKTAQRLVRSKRSGLKARLVLFSSDASGQSARASYQVTIRAKTARKAKKKTGKP